MEQNLKVGDKVVLNSDAPPYYDRKIVFKIIKISNGVAKLNKSYCPESSHPCRWIYLWQLDIDGNSIRRKKIRKIQRKLKWQKILRLGIM